jgi:hypothetical protein
MQWLDQLKRGDDFLTFSVSPQFGGFVAKVRSPELPTLLLIISQTYDHAPQS